MRKIFILSMIFLLMVGCKKNPDDFIGSWGKDPTKPDFVFSKSENNITLVSNQLADYRKGKFIPKKFRCIYKEPALLCNSSDLSQSYTMINGMLVDQKETRYPRLN